MQRIKLALWAFRNTEKLSNLRAEMKLAAEKKTTTGRHTAGALRCSWWLERYLTFP